MQRIGEHAVVIGASMAGLLAARALSGRLRARDGDRARRAARRREGAPGGAAGPPRPRAAPARAGVPRGAAAGRRRRADRGGRADLRGDGADARRDGRPPVRPRRARAPARSSPAGRCSRATCAGACGRWPASSCATAATRSGWARPRGRARQRRAASSAAPTEARPRRCAADLVVCATGRAARVPAWLEGSATRGRPRSAWPSTSPTRAATCGFPPDALDGDRLVLVGARPGLPRTLFLFAQEGGRWIATLGGYGPSTARRPTPTGCAAFAATVAPPAVAEAIARRRAARRDRHAPLPGQRAPPLRPPARFPSGLLVCGDALCSFNPIYGQGMTVAAAQAVALRHCLERRRARPRAALLRAPPRPRRPRLAARDRRRPRAARGARAPPAGVRAVNAYLRRLRAVAEHDPAVARRLHRRRGHARAAAARAAARRRRCASLRGPRPARWREPRRRRAPRRAARGERAPRRCARPAPASAREAVVLRPRQPRLERRLGAAARRRRSAPARRRVGRARLRSRAPPRPVPADRRRARRFIGRALDALGIERAHLVLHDFGGPWGLRWAAGDPERFACAVLLGTGALPGYRWHALARALAHAAGSASCSWPTTTRRGFRLALRRGNRAPLPRAVPGPHV